MLQSSADKKQSGQKHDWQHTDRQTDRQTGMEVIPWQTSVGPICSYPSKQMHTNEPTMFLHA